MKKFLVMLLICCAAAASAKDLSVLMIGNSFSLPLTNTLHHIVKASGKHKVYLASCYIGGCSLRTHWANVEKYNESLKAGDPKKVHRPYGIRYRDSSLEKQPANKSASVVEMLKERKWDVITIQQASHESVNYKLYQPAADKLIKVIRELQPEAEIVIQHTWSYASDSTRLKSWKVDQNGMYDMVHASYSQLAEHTSFRMIPVGQAVQIWRKKFPGLKQDVVGKSYGKDKDGNPRRDTIHLNWYGEYMQGCLWYAFLFDEDANSVTWIPKNMKEEKAKELRAAAQQALTEYKAAGKNAK